MSYYQYHVFFCTNQREGQLCCAKHGAHKIRGYAKEKLKQLEKHGQGQVRVNIAGCLGRCSEGPVLVVYPDETWYTYIDEEDIDDIIEQHLLNGKIVERLKI